MYNFDNSIYRIIFILLRAGLNWTTIPHADWNECQKILKIDWDAIYKECVRHGVLAIAWDGLLRLVEENVIPSSISIICNNRLFQYKQPKHIILLRSRHKSQLADTTSM